MSKKRVFITGSSRGIGAGIARKLSENYEVILHGKTLSNPLESLALELNAKVLTFDISSTQQCQEALSPLSQEEALWGIVLNAGIRCDNTFVGLSEGEWKSVINTNLNSFFNILNPLLMPMVRLKRGRVVAIGSVSGSTGNRGQSNYAASKAGLIGAAKSLAIELASRNITVNVVEPGLIQTDMIEDSSIPLEQILQLIPAKRIGKVEEVASLVNFLLSEESGYITKQVIGVNGGLA